MNAIQKRGYRLAALGALQALLTVDQAHAASPASASAEAVFMSLSQAAMNRMMHAMDVAPTGNVDADFAGMMIPHHQSAIDMAKAELLYGHNEQLRRIAQEIIVGQRREIAAMNLALGHPPPASKPSPDQPADLGEQASHRSSDAQSK